MPAYLIGYDLHEGEDYADLEDAIQKLGLWWHCLDSTWIVIHPGSAKTIADSLTTHLRRPGEQATKNKDAGDRLLVARISKGDSAWTKSFSDECDQWLKSNL